LIDFDAFYAQCETVRLELSPTIPLAVQQWNAIIALNYPARDFGLKRGASVEEARRLCPEFMLQHVATWREGKTTWA
jgi:DNA polymerase eta